VTITDQMLTEAYCAFVNKMEGTRDRKEAIRAALEVGLSYTATLPEAPQPTASNVYEIIAHATDESLEPRNRLQGVIARLQSLRPATQRSEPMAAIGKPVRERLNEYLKLTGIPPSDWQKLLQASGAESAKDFLCHSNRGEYGRPDEYLYRIAQTIEDLQVALASQIEITNTERANKERAEASLVREAPRDFIAPQRIIDIVFDGPPGHKSGRFVEVESPPGTSINFGQWIPRGTGYWGLRFALSSPAPSGTAKVPEDLMRTLRTLIKDFQTDCERDAARWRKARMIFAVEDIERADAEMAGFTATKEENEKADAAIDAARGYKYLQGRLESIGYHGWAHDYDGEIEATTLSADAASPNNEKKVARKLVESWDAEQRARSQSIADEPWDIKQARALLAKPGRQTAAAPSPDGNEENGK